MIKTVNVDDDILAADWMAEFQNILNNMDPTGIDDESADDSAAQATSDPYAGSSLVKAVSLKGEIQQLRYLIAQITGKTYWYIDPDTSLATLATLIPAGTIMLFGQNSAPTGWTRKANWQDNAMLCYAASGNIGNGGSANPQSTHTHSGPSHTHTGPSHQHSIPSVDLDHTGELASRSGGNHIATASVGGVLQEIGGASGYEINAKTETGTTGAEGTGNTGAGGTGATGANTAPHYQEVIAATKD